VLENQALAIGRKIRLGVVAAEGDLPDVGEMDLTRLGRPGDAGPGDGSGRAGVGGEQRDCGDQD